MQSVEAESQEQKTEIAAVAEDMEVLVRENQTATHQLGRAEAAVQQLQADLDQVAMCAISSCMCPTWSRSKGPDSLLCCSIPFQLQHRWNTMYTPCMQAHEQRMRLEQTVQSRDKHVAELQDACDVSVPAVCMHMHQCTAHALQHPPSNQSIC